MSASQEAASPWASMTPRHLLARGPLALLAALAALAGALALRSATAAPSQPAAQRPGAAAPAPGGPLASLGPESQERRVIEGRPVERLKAGTYTYVRIEDDQGVSRWVVMMGGLAGAATRVRATTMARATDFPSQRLGRRFDELFFGVIRPLTP